MVWGSRVTVDIDAYGPNWQLRAVRAYHNLAHIADRVDVTVSSSWNGIHLVGWFDALLEDDEIERLRRTLSDDGNRVKMDEVRGEHGHPTQVLWTSKGSRDHEAQQDFEDIYDALEFVEHQRSDYERVHDLANDGRRSITEMSVLTRSGHADGL